MNSHMSYVGLGDPKPLIEDIDQVDDKKSVDVMIDVIGRNPRDNAQKNVQEET